jgi:CubicO group peptidase (beta-lactamase class C family)
MKEISPLDSMAEFPPPPARQVTLEKWQSPPFNRWSFNNARRIVPTARIRRSMRAKHHFASSLVNFDELVVTPSARPPRTLADVLRDTYTDGFLVIHRGRILYEYYAGALREDATHLVWSVSKSVVSSLIGILVGKGVLEINRPAGHYVAELPRDGYGSVVLDRLLDMRSGIKYSEDYTDPDSDFALFDEVCGFRPRLLSRPGQGVYGYLASLHGDPSDPGDFCYRSTDTDVLGWVAERATGVALERLLETELWAPLGTEEDADLLVDPVGSPIADGGFCATLRDIGRFAQMHLDNGALEGRQIVPEQWIAACSRGDRNAYARKGYTSVFPRGAYARKWWIADTERPVRLALGIHGQMIYLDPRNELACVKLSSTPQAIDLETLGLTVGVCGAIADSLRKT